MASLTARYAIDIPQTMLSLLFQSVCLNLSHTFHSGSPKNFPRSSLLFIRLETTATNFSCIYLTPQLNWPSKARVRILNYISTSSPYRDCISRGGTYISLNTSSFYPTGFNTSKRCTPNTNFCCPANHRVCEVYHNKSPPNRCTYWEGHEREYWQLYYLPPKAERAPTRPRDAKLQGGPLFSPCDKNPSLGSKHNHMV